MRYVFFGTPEFAAIILEKLIGAGLIPAFVVCNPDRPAGRKKILTPPPVKQRIMNYESGIRNKIKILQPEKLDKDFLNSLFLIHNSSPFDFFVVAAYGKIIPQKLLEIPRRGTIGVHPSLLPKYRGATPIQTAILNGEDITGVTLFLMDEQIDHGPVLAQRTLENGELGMMNYETLHDKLAELAGNMLVETIPKYLKGEYTLHPQNDKDATYTKKFKDDDAFVDLEKDDPILIERKVRALNPEPGVWTFQNNKRMKILEAELIDGKIKLKKIQFEGKKPQLI